MSAEHLLTKLSPGGTVIDNVQDTSRTPRKRGRRESMQETHGTATRSVKRPNIAPSDVAAALAGLPDKAYYFTLAKYTDDERAANKFIALFAELAGRLWPGISDDQARGVVYLSVEGSLWFAHCSKCLGRKVVYDRAGRPRDCDKCKGTGRGQLSAAKAGKMVSVSETAYRKTWSKRVAILQSVLTDYEDRAQKHVGRRIFSDGKAEESLEK